MKKKLLSLLIGVVLSLLFLEVSLRIHNPLEASVKGDNIVLTRNKTFTVVNHDIATLDREITHTKNSLGFRGDNPPRNFEDFTTIVTVGGSTTECFYVSDGKAWPALLGRRLQDEVGNIWLNNAGLDGHSTFGHLILLNSYLTKIRPDYILFLVGCNDVGRDDLGAYDAGIFVRESRSTGFSGLVIKTAEYSELVSTMLNVFRSFQARKQQLYHRQIILEDLDRLELSVADESREVEKHRETLVAYEHRLRQLAAVCRDNGIEPIFATQPALYGDAIDDRSGVDLATIKMSDRMNGHLKWRVLQMYNQATKDVAAELGILCIDVADRIPKSSRFFYDYIHFTNDGCVLVADAIYEELAPYLESRTRADEQRIH